MKPDGAAFHTSAHFLLGYLSYTIFAAEWSGTENLNHVSDAIKRERRAPMNEFEVFHDKGANTWTVVGGGIERFVQMTNWQ